MHYPVPPKYKVTQAFGATDFSQGKGKYIYQFFGGLHPGLDFAMPVGEPIYACLPGFVTSIEYHRGMGKTIRIRYGNIQHIYGHLSEFKVDFGDYVTEGQEIGLSGDSVVWTVPHLHFEMRDLTVYEVAERPFDPDFEAKLPSQFKETFTYTANHSEALIDLALKFFGTEAGVNTIKSANLKLESFDQHQSLAKGTKINVS